MSVERSEEVMRRYIAEVIGEKKLEVIDEIAAEDMFDRGQPKPGRDGLWKHVRDFLAIVPDPKVVIHDIVGQRGHGHRHLALAWDAGGRILQYSTDGA